MSTLADLDARAPAEGDARRHALTNALPALVLVTAADGLGAIFGNARFLAYTGLSSAALWGEGWLQVLHPDDIHRVRAAAQGSRAPFEGHYRLRRCDGQYRRHICRREPMLRDQAGNIVEWMVSCVEVETDGPGDEARALLAAIVSASDDAIVSKSLDGVIRSWNAAAERLFGYRAEEAIGRPITLIIPPERHHEEDQILAKLRRGERVDHFETVRRAKDGRLLDLSVTISPVLDEAGKVIGASKVARDIGERKRAEADLRAAEALYRELVENANSAIIRWSCDGTVRFANGFAEKLFGYPDGALLGRDVRVLVPSEDSSGTDLSTLVEDIVAHPASYRHNVNENVTRDGHRLWMLWTNRPVFDARGEVAEILAIGSDVTKLKQAEDTLREADRRKSEFLAVLGHELRNPLAPLTSGLELLQHARDDAALSDKTLTMMRRQLGHLVRLVDDLVDVSRISRGTIELRREPLDLRDLLDAAVELTRPSFVERHHQLIMARAEDVLAVEGDRERLTQVVANLLVNAAKYTPPGGTVTVASETMDDRVLVYVRDNGLGIPPERLSELFDMFTRVPEHRAHDPGSGLGVGLALARQLIALHGGTIEARSEGLGRGSEFIVRLPRAAVRQAVDGPEEPAPQAAVRPSRILVVDDNVDAADSLVELLRLTGHQVKAVHDGVAALEEVARFSPQIVLLDIGLPRIDGYEVARRIRATERGDQILLVALTGWGQEKDRRLSRKAGFDQHITKPIDLATLAGLIARRETFA